MSIFEYALALLPAAAALAILLTILADRREASALNELCSLECDRHHEHDHDDTASCAA